MELKVATDKYYSLVAIFHIYTHIIGSEVRLRCQILAVYDQ